MIINLLAVGIGLLAGYIASKEPAGHATSEQPKDKDPFTVAFDCETDTVSWTGVPSGAGSIALFAVSKTRMSTQVVANIPATRNMITFDDALLTFIFSEININSGVGCVPMFSFDGAKSCPGDFEITAFAIQDPILVARRHKSIGSPMETTSPAEIRDLAESKALAKTSTTVQCLGKDKNN